MAKQLEYQAPFWFLLGHRHTIEKVRKNNAYHKMPQFPTAHSKSVLFYFGFCYGSFVVCLLETESSPCRLDMPGTHRVAQAGLNVLQCTCLSLPMLGL